MHFPPIDSNIPISTANANNVRKTNNLEEQEDIQSHSKSFSLKPISIPEPIIEENTTEMDLTLDHFLNPKTKQQPLVAKEQLGFEVPVDVSIPVLVFKTNDSMADQSMQQKTKH